MSDAKLRELERRWKETGTVEDEAAYLLERVRVGDLSRERLELAAYCGHEGARRATGPVAHASGDLETTARGIGFWGRVPVLVGVREVVRSVKSKWELSRRGREAFEAANAILAGAPAEQFPVEIEIDLEVESGAWNAIFATYRLYEAVIAGSDSASVDCACEALRNATLADCGGGPDALARDLDGPASPAFVAAVDRLLRSTVISWALGPFTSPEDPATTSIVRRDQ
jgi:hypothetical protein